MALRLSESAPASSVLEGMERLWTSGPLAAACRVARLRVEDGRPLSRALVGVLPPWVCAALEAGEAGGDPAAGTRIALAGLAPSRRPARSALGPARSLLVGSLCAGLLGLALSLGLPAFGALELQARLLGGGVEPGVIEQLAAYSGLLSLACFAIALVPLALPLAFLLLREARVVSTPLLVLPLLGALVRARSAATFARSLSLQLSADLPLEGAWSLACRAVEIGPLRRMLLLRETEILDGEPLDVVLDRVGMPEEITALWRIGLGADDNGVRASDLMARAAESAAARLASKATALLHALGYGVAVTSALAAGVFLWVPFRLAGMF